MPSIPMTSSSQRSRWQHVDVDDPPRADLHDHEDVGDREQRGVLGQEVAGPDLAGMVANEGAPGLVATGRRLAQDHVPTDRTGRMQGAELGGKLFGDLVFAPFGMIA
jgi:hypothetical protein